MLSFPLTWESGSSASGQVHERIEGDFPHMAVGVGEIAGITAPKRFGRWLDRFGSGGNGLRVSGVHLLRRRLVMSQGDAAKSLPIRHASVFRQLVARIERQPGAF